MANLKAIRKRIATVKSTQKITRAMKMVAGARLNRAQQRITSMRPYAVAVERVLQETGRNAIQAGGPQALELPFYSEEVHPLLARREEKGILLFVVTSDRGLCGSFNANICKCAERVWRTEEAAGKRVQFSIIGRKGRDYFRRRGAEIHFFWEDVWGDLNLRTQIRPNVRRLLKPFLEGEYDAIRMVYNRFQSAVTQHVTDQYLLPVHLPPEVFEEQPEVPSLYVTEPDRDSVAQTLVPMYVEITILRALYESMASELGARMTAMDAATKNAAEVIARLTLQYNRARQAAITTEIMEIISGAEALRG